MTAAGARRVIRGGDVIDGTAGAVASRADVLVEDGRIAAVGDLPDVDAEVLDAAGHVVVPGFIDVHSHSDFTLLVDPRAHSALAQGVTTEIVGNCGHGCFPVRDPVVARRSVYGWSEDAELSDPSAASYLTRLEDRRPAVNVATLVPHGQLRLAVMGVADRVAAPHERRQMRRLLDADLDAGAWGLSTGLEYPHEQRALEAEIVDLCARVAARDGLYATHTRDRAAGAVAAVEEALGTAASAGVRLQISHLVPRGGDAQLQRCLELVDASAAAGSDVMFDMHTRLFGFTHLVALLPADALEGDIGAIVARLRSADFREHVRRHTGMLDLERQAELISIDGATPFPDLAGRDLAAIAAETGRSPVDVVCDLVLDTVDEPEAVRIRLATYTPGQQRTVFSHPSCLPASDATTLCPDGPLATSVFHGAYDWAAWYLRAMVRESGVVDLSAAIHRLTQLPAIRLGIADRGSLRPGMAADVVVMDPTRVRETTTADDPNRLAEGVRTVLVNGGVAVHDGRPTDDRRGRVLRSPR